jgi:hypothetical protein
VLNDHKITWRSHVNLSEVVKDSERTKWLTDQAEASASRGEMVLAVTSISSAETEIEKAIMAEGRLVESKTKARDRLLQIQLVNKWPPAL